MECKPKTFISLIKNNFLLTEAENLERVSIIGYLKLLVLPREMEHVHASQSEAVYSW